MRHLMMTCVYSALVGINAGFSTHADNPFALFNELAAALCLLAAILSGARWVRSVPV